MKKFNEVITVEVEVDTIAEKLLASFKEDNPHRELITEHIIGTALHQNKVSGLYNVLNGYTGDIDFKEGQEVYCPSSTYNYVNEGTEETPDWRQKSTPIGNAVIKKIDIYRDDKVQVEFTTYNRSGVASTDVKWVNHRNLQAVITTVTD